MNGRGAGSFTELVIGMIASLVNRGHGSLAHYAFKCFAPFAVSLPEIGIQF